MERHRDEAKEFCDVWRDGKLGLRRCHARRPRKLLPQHAALSAVAPPLLCLTLTSTTPPPYTLHLRPRPRLTSRSVSARSASAAAAIFAPFQAAAPRGNHLLLFLKQVVLACHHGKTLVSKNSNQGLNGKLSQVSVIAVSCFPPKRPSSSPATCSLSAFRRGRGLHPSLSRAGTLQSSPETLSRPLNPAIFREERGREGGIFGGCHESTL